MKGCEVSTKVCIPMQNKYAPNLKENTNIIPRARAGLVSSQLVTLCVRKSLKY